MATVTERLDSGEGDKIGIHGSHATRRFDVQLREGELDDATGNLDRLDDPLSPIKARYPPHSWHNVHSGLVVTDYVKGSRYANTLGRWQVDVVYEVPLAGDVADYAGWTLEFDNSLQSEEMVRDLTGQIVGGRAYKQPPPETSGLFSAETIEGLVELIQYPKVITPKPLTVFMPTYAIRASRTVTMLTLPQYRRARTYNGTVNKSVFLDVCDPGTALFQGPLVRRRSGEVEGQTQSETGIVYDIVLTFLGNDNGWAPERIYDRFEFKGFEGEVLDGESNPVFNDFFGYRESEMADLLRLFGGGIRQAPTPVPV